MRMAMMTDMTVTKKLMKKYVMRAGVRDDESSAAEVQLVTSRPPQPIDRQSVNRSVAQVLPPSSMDNSVIAKSGWLYKKGTDNVWVKNRVELYRDGYLKYYESDHSPNAEDTIFMPTECTRIKTGTQVDAGPERSVPDRHSPLCLFSVMTGSQEWTFCGETLDDMRAWQLALEQARLLILRPAFPSRPSYPCYINTSSDGLMTQSPYLAYGHLPPTYVPALSAGPLTFFPPGHPLEPHPYSTMSQRTPFPAEYHLPQFPPTSPDPAVMYASQSHPYPQQIAPHNPYTRPDGADVAMGMLAGAAVGSMMWGSPYFWW